MAIRNKLFDLGVLSSSSYDLPIISIGNITVGGTGKTPVTEHLLRVLLPHKHCATLSRGYGRKTKGVIISGETNDYTTIGDEPMQMKLKFPEATIAVAEKRVNGILALLNQPSPPEVILLDDAFQHRYVKPGLSIIVIDYNRPIWKDICFPAGNLREGPSGINRADIIIVNKCPSNLNNNEAQKIKEKLKLKNNQKVFFTSIYFNDAVALKNNESNNKLSTRLSQKNNPLIAISGIGNPTPFYESLKQFNTPFQTKTFKDHHIYTLEEISSLFYMDAIDSSARPLVVTTEKDAVRIKNIRGLNDDILANIWYIPIHLKFLFNKETIFNKLIIDYAKRNK